MLTFSGGAMAVVTGQLANMTVAVPSTMFANNIAQDNSTLCFQDANLVALGLKSAQGITPTQAPFPTSGNCNQFIRQA